MLHAYLDDSGTHAGSPLCAVSGYFGSEKRWIKFNAEWRKVLDEFQVEEFHANHFWSAFEGGNVTEYRGWGRERASEFVNRLLNLIQGSQRIFPVSCAMLMAEWDKLKRDEQAYLTGAQYVRNGVMATPGAPKKPYFVPFLTCIKTILSYCKPGHIVNFSFDDSRNFSGAREYFEQMKAWNPGNFESLGRNIFHRQQDLFRHASRRPTRL